jgi:hypothetical protein
MKTIHSQIAHRLFAMLLAAIAQPQLVVAQDFERPIDAGDLRLRGRIVIGRREFDHWASGRVPGIDEVRDRYESALKSRVDRTVRLYGLSEAQTKKLQLAGRGDIKRLLDRVEETRKKARTPARDADEFQAVVPDDRPLHLMPSAELFGEGSLFAKTLKTTVTKEQFSRYEKVALEVSLRHHRATLQWVLGTWDQTLALNSEQHRRLEALLIRETRPPKRFGEEDYFGVLFQISRLPEATLKPLFSEDQWAKLCVQLLEAKRKEPALKKDGYVPDNDVAAAPEQPDDTSGTHKNEQG